MGVRETVQERGKCKEGPLGKDLKQSKPEGTKNTIIECQDILFSKKNLFY